MTNRAWIETTRHLHEKMACWLRPYFSHFDVKSIPIVIRQIRAYGRNWDVASDGKDIWIDPNYWKTIDTNRLFQRLSHELTHIEQYRTQGWIKWTWRTITTVLWSIPNGSLYDHSVSADEIEANERQQQVYLSMLIAMSQWSNLLDSDCP